MHNNIKGVLKSRDNLTNATNKNLIATMVRLWVEWDPKVHALNYWYYRYFTNKFELFCLKTKYSKEDDDNEYKRVNCTKDEKEIPQEAVEGMISALEDVKNGDYTVIESDDDNCVNHAPEEGQ